MIYFHPYIKLGCPITRLTWNVFLIIWRIFYMNTLRLVRPVSHHNRDNSSCSHHKTTLQLPFWLGHICLLYREGPRAMHAHAEHKGKSNVLMLCPRLRRRENSQLGLEKRGTPLEGTHWLIRHSSLSESHNPTPRTPIHTQVSFCSFSFLLGWLTCN